MHHPAIFDTQPMMGELDVPQSEVFEFFEQGFEPEWNQERAGRRPRPSAARPSIRRRRAAPMLRGGRAMPTGARQRPIKPSPVRRHAALPLRPRPRPRPRPGRPPRGPQPAWPPLISNYPIPIVAEPFRVSDDASAPEQLRCVQNCLRGGTAAPPPPAASDASADAPAVTEDAGDAGAAGEPGAEEFEQFKFRDEYGGLEEHEARFDDELDTGEAEGEASAGLMTLPRAIADPRSAGAGIYTIFKSGQRLYVGRASDLRRRLQQHLWCLTHLALGAGRYRVKLTPMRGATPAKLSRVEAAVIDRFGRRARGGQLANVKAREFEQESWNAGWR